MAFSCPKVHSFAKNLGKNQNLLNPLPWLHQVVKFGLNFAGAIFVTIHYSLKFLFSCSLIASTQNFKFLIISAKNLPRTTQLQFGGSLKRLFEMKNLK